MNMFVCFQNIQYKVFETHWFLNVPFIKERKRSEKLLSIAMKFKYFTSDLSVLNTFWCHSL